MRRRCCCDDGPCPITLEFRNSCQAGSPLVPTVGYAVKDAGGVVVAAGTTDATGKVVVTVPSPGSYTVAPSKTNYFVADKAIAVGCGGTFAVPTNSGGVNFFVKSCGFNLGGAVFAIGGATGTARADGQFRWAPPAPGVYPYTVTHPSGRFAPFSSSVTVTSANICSLFPPTINLTPAEGYSCCLSSSAFPLPHKSTLLATTSAGDTFPVVSCGYYGCAPSEVVRTGGEPGAMACAVPTSWSMPRFPADLGTGKVNVLVTMSLSATSGTCRLRFEIRQAQWPQTEACADRSAANQRVERWYKSPSPTCEQLKAGVSSSREWDGTFTLNSQDPWSGTWTFTSALPLAYGFNTPQESAAIPPPFSSITVVEP